MSEHVSRTCEFCKESVALPVPPGGFRCHFCRTRLEGQETHLLPHRYFRAWVNEYIVLDHLHLTVCGTCHRLHMDAFVQRHLQTLLEQ